MFIYCRGIIIIILLAENLYLVTYRELKRTGLNRGKWVKMAEKINKTKRGGCPVTPDQCRLKIKTLKDKYKRNMQRSRKSGSERVVIPANLRDAFEHEFDFNVVPLESALKRG